MRPLDGIRVLDLSRVLAGPYCTMLLADMGAEVIKVEEPGRGDDTRAWPPFQGDQATYFLSVNRGKKSLTLNLKAAEGRAILRGLIERADVLLENFRPGTIERLGFGYETVRAWNPRLVYCSLSGFGATGPEAGRPGYDLIVQGESGIMDLTGFPDGPPAKVGIAIADLASGAMAAHGIVLALYARERTAVGQRVEVAMLEVMAALLAFQGQLYLSTGQSPTRRGNQHPSIVPYEVFRAADAYLTVGVANNALWERFCRAIDHPELAADPRFDTEARRVEHRDILSPLLDRIFAERPAAEWLARLDAAGVPAGRINRVSEVLDSEQLKAREMIVPLHHPTAGPLRVVGIPIRLEGTPGAITAPPPLLGEHTEEILGKLLAHSPAEVAELRRRGDV
ncbi:MAG: CoA transferase [Candidatus Rokubacteria bacterium]|nr:CoA transferase [Candidatus Rokubacteria bacterium]